MPNITDVMFQNFSGNGRRKIVSDDYEMTPHDHHLIIDSSSAAVDVTLPSLGEAHGIYVLEAPDGGSNDASLLIKETGSELGSGGDMDADDEYTILVPTSQAWVVLATSVS